MEICGRLSGDGPDGAVGHGLAVERALGAHELRAAAFQRRSRFLAGDEAISAVLSCAADPVRRRSGIVCLDCIR